MAKMIGTVGELKEALKHIPDHYEVWARDIDCYAHEIASVGCGEKHKKILLSNGETVDRVTHYCVIDLDHKE